MLEVKEAVSAAREAARDFFDETPLNDLQLEEVEFEDSTETWLITLGFNVKNMNPMSGLGAALSGGQQFIRKYKVFSIDANSGKVKSMKIREV